MENGTQNLLMILLTSFEECPIDGSEIFLRHIGRRSERYYAGMVLTVHANTALRSTIQTHTIHSLHSFPTVLMSQGNGDCILTYLFIEVNQYLACLAFFIINYKDISLIKPTNGL